jgi:hypothetical protein
MNTSGSFELNASFMRSHDSSVNASLRNDFIVRMFATLLAPACEINATMSPNATRVFDS